MVSSGLGLFNFTIFRLIELLFLKFIYFAPSIYYCDFWYKNFNKRRCLIPINSNGRFQNLILDCPIIWNFKSKTEKFIHTISCIMINLKKTGLAKEALGNLLNLTTDR